MRASRITAPNSEASRPVRLKPLLLMFGAPTSKLRNHPPSAAPTTPTQRLKTTARCGPFVLSRSRSIPSRSRRPAKG